MVRLPSRSAPGFVLANSADTATKCRAGRFLPGTPTLPKALGLETKRGSDGRASGELNLEQRTLGHCCPEGTDFGIPTDHLMNSSVPKRSCAFCISASSSQ